MKNIFFWTASRALLRPTPCIASDFLASSTGHISVQQSWGGREHPADTTVGPSKVSGLQPASVHTEEHTAGGKKLKPSKAVLMLLTKGQGNAPKTFPFCCWNMKMTRLASKTWHHFFRSTTFTEHYIVWTMIWRHDSHKNFLNKIHWYSCLQLMQTGSRNYNAHSKEHLTLQFGSLLWISHHCSFFYFWPSHFVTQHYFLVLENTVFKLSPVNRRLGNFPS